MVRTGSRGELLKEMMLFRVPVFRAAALLAAVVFLFTLSLRAQPPAPEQAAAPQPVTETGALPPELKQQMEQAAAATRGHTGYLLRPGDEIEVRCHLIPQINQVARVRPDGKISLVLVNDVQAGGHTPEQLSEMLTLLYGKHFRNPQVTAIVRAFNSLNVYVGGEVPRAGLVPLGGGLTVTAAIFQAGGFKEEDGVRKVVLLRQGVKGPEITNLDVEEILLRGKPDPFLQPSDVLFVPKSQINVYVGGEVVEPGLIPLTGKMTALSAIIKARGLKPTAKKNVILIRNTGDEKPAMVTLNLKEIITKGTGDRQLQAFDVVFVPKSRIAKIDQFVDQYMRQLLPIGVNFGFSYLLGGQLLF